MGVSPARGNGLATSDAGNIARMVIRPRHADDVEKCARMLTDIWERDRYPIYLPDDVAAFVASGDELGAWVATDPDNRVVGHVALRRTSWDGVVDVALEALDCGEGDVAVIARLMVAPSARRAGIGRALLAHATAEANKLHRTPILDVAAHYHAAIALYEHAGWHRIGTSSFPLPDGSAVTEIIFTAPR